MATDVNNVCEEMSAPHSSCFFDTKNYSYDVQRAGDMLLHRKFTESYDLCQRKIGEAKNYPEEPCACEAVESFCIIAIQALAELNKWQEVLPFITQLYNGIEHCPEKVAQLCVLLHAHVGDYTTCTAVTHIWLRTPGNQEKPGYVTLIELYIQHVLIPQQKWTDIPTFVDNCSSLVQEKKDLYLKYVESAREKALHNKLRSEALQDKKKKEINKKNQDIIESISQSVLDLVQKLGCFVSRRIPVMTMKVIRNLMMIGLLAYLVMYRAYTDPSQLFGLAGIWQNIQRLWRGMFAPYHLSGT